MRYRKALYTALVFAAALLQTGSAGAQAPFPSIDTVRVNAHDNPSWASPDIDDGAWEEIPWQQIDPQGRLIWVRSHVTMPDPSAFERTPLAVYVSALAAYEVYWNGERIGGSGTPGPLRALEVPGRLDTSHFVSPRLIRNGDNVLALRMSSFHLRRALFSPMQFLALDEYGTLGRRVLTGRLPVLGAAGALLLGSVYFATLFLSDRRDRGSLLLSLLSLGVLVQLGVELSRSIVGYTYPLHLLRLELVLGAAAASGLLLVGYVTGRYAPHHRWSLFIVTALSMAASIMVWPGFDDKTAFVMLSTLCAVIVAATFGARARCAGAPATLVVAIGLVAWFGTRRISFIDESYYLVATAGLLFLFAQQVTTLRRAQKVQAVSELRTARLELELLKRQLQPHFLMNSLTAVTEWIESDPQTGVRMIEALANELRALAAMSGKMLVPLAEEIQLCRQHLQVMGYRKDRAFTLVTPSVDGTQRVPPAIFHTLIENAVTHNSYARGAELRLDASDSTNGRVTYQLRSPFERSTWAGGEGRGHAYVRARLQEAFGDRWSFTSGPDGADWVDTIDIPKA